MANDFYTKDYKESRETLLALRFKEKKDYQYMIVFNLFYNLSPLNKMFFNVDNVFFTGSKRMSDPALAAKFLHDYEQNIFDGLIECYSDAFSTLGIPIYHLNSIQFKDRINDKTNAQIEELEFTYITYIMTKNLILSWMHLGLLGFSKRNAYLMVAQDVQVFFDENSFESIFKAIEQQALYWLVGLKSFKGEQLQNNILYEPLPAFY